MRLGNRTYRAWGNMELPKYLLKLHATLPLLPNPVNLNSDAIPANPLSSNPDSDNAHTRHPTYFLQDYETFLLRIASLNVNLK